MNVLIFAVHTKRKKWVKLTFLAHAEQKWEIFSCISRHAWSKAYPLFHAKFSISEKLELHTVHFEQNRLISKFLLQ